MVHGWRTLRLVDGHLRNEGSMRIDEVRRLIRLVEESEISELEVWKWWGRIRIRKGAVSNGNSEVVVQKSGFMPAITPTLETHAPPPQNPEPASPALDR